MNDKLIKMVSDAMKLQLSEKDYEPIMRKYRNAIRSCEEEVESLNYTLDFFKDLGAKAPEFAVILSVLCVGFELENRERLEGG